MKTAEEKDKKNKNKKSKRPAWVDEKIRLKQAEYELIQKGIMKHRTIGL